MDMTGKTAVVTGAGSGIGAAMCQVFAAHGARVAALDLDAASAEAVAEPLPDALALTVDVSNPDQVESAFARTGERFGTVDVVVHAAGVDDPAAKKVAQAQVSEGTPIDVLAGLTDEQWQRIVSINLGGSFFVLRAAVRLMKPQGSGAIVLVGSEAGVRGVAGLPHYAASKGGVHALVRTAAKELIAHGIRLNGIAPGVIDTPMSRRSKGNFGGVGGPVAPIGRPGTPEELANVALFLSSDLATYVVGEVVNVDGGRMAS